MTIRTWQIYGKNNTKCCPVGERNTREKEIEKRCKDLEGDKKSDMYAAQSLCSHLLVQYIWIYTKEKWVRKSFPCIFTWQEVFHFFDEFLCYFSVDFNLVLSSLQFPIEVWAFQLGVFCHSSDVFKLEILWEIAAVFSVLIAWQGELSHYEPQVESLGVALELL